MTDPYVGQLTFLRLYSGSLNSGDSIYNANKRKRERIGRLVKMHADKREEIKTAGSGDIVAAVGLKGTTDRRQPLRPRMRPSFSKPSSSPNR